MARGRDARAAHFIYSAEVRCPTRVVRATRRGAGRAGDGAAGGVQPLKSGDAGVPAREYSEAVGVFIGE